MTLTVTIGGEEIRLATVTFDSETGFYRSYIGPPQPGLVPGREAITRAAARAIAGSAGDRTG